LLVENLKDSIQIVFMITSTVTIFQLQLGVTMLEVGQVSSRSTTNILINNIFDLVIGAIGFYFIGYGFMNNAAGGFIGDGSIFFSDNLS
jgi:ammonia channel protein AmtB